MSDEIKKEELEQQEQKQEVVQPEVAEEDKEAPKKIEVITGNGELTISPVYEHLEVEKPKPKENRKIFIPEVKGNSNNSTKETVKDNDVAENNIENIVENDNDE